MQYYDTAGNSMIPYMNDTIWNHDILIQNYTKQPDKRKHVVFPLVAPQREMLFWPYVPYQQDNISCPYFWALAVTTDAVILLGRKVLVQYDPAYSTTQFNRRSRTQFISMNPKLNWQRVEDWEKKSQLQIHFLLQHHGQRGAFIDTQHTLDYWCYRSHWLDN